MESSCVHIVVWPSFCKESICNVDCARYEWDEITKPETASRKKSKVAGKTSHNKQSTKRPLNKGYYNY